MDPVAATLIIKAISLVGLPLIETITKWRGDKIITEAQAKQLLETSKARVEAGDAAYDKAFSDFMNDSESDDVESESDYENLSDSSSYKFDTNG